jgi:RimJ/RimL family protein N-acetyltransferase
MGPLQTPHLFATLRTADRELAALEPTHDEVVRASPLLADFYNDPYNRSMMANTVAMTADEVVEHFDSLGQSGGRPFVLQVDGKLVGDADFRHVTATTAEFAILVGERSLQGKGIGLGFGILLHALAFRAFALERVFVAIIPENVPSQRLFAKLGYAADDTQLARSFADEASDLTFSLGRDDFEAKHGATAARVSWRAR